MRNLIARVRAVACAPGRDRSRAAATAALVLLAAAYAAQIVTPLRLWLDGIVYLSMAESAAQGRGFLYQGRPAAYPQGYPAVVALLDRAGLASSESLVALNLLFLALGVWASYRLCRAALNLGLSTSLWVCCYACLSWAMVKHATLPATDVIVFGLSMYCLHLLVRAHQEPEGRGNVVRLAGALLLIAAAFLMRTAAVALAPAWMLACGRRLAASGIWREARGAWRFLRWGLALAPLLVAAGLVGPALLRSSYFGFALAMWTGSPWEMLGQTVVGRCRELGHLAVNVPATRVPPTLLEFFPVVGVVVIMVLVWSLWGRLRWGPLEVFLFSYLGLLCVWPPLPPDPRLWLPVFTLLPGMVVARWRAVRRRWPASRLAACYLVAFGALGAGALVYSTRISWSGSAFPEHYGAPWLRSVYRAALGGPQIVAPSETEADALRLLRRYERRARLR